MSSFKSAMKNTIKNTVTKVKSNLSNPIGNTAVKKAPSDSSNQATFASSIANKAMNETVLDPKKAASWRDDGGYWWNNGFRYGKDYNGDGRFQTNEVDPALYQNVVKTYEDNERQILTTGKSSIGPSNWDEAEQQNVISHEEAERGRASGQTFLDGRKGAGYVVEHKHTQGEDPLEGAAKDQFYNELEASQGMPTAQALAIANDSKKRGRENYLANGVTDILKDQVEYTGGTFNPFVIQEGEAKNRIDAVANANANLMAEEGIRALTRMYGGEENGSTAMDLPAGTYVVDMNNVIYDGDKGHFVHEVKDGSFNTTDGRNALYARVSGDAPSLLGSAAAREDAGLFSDILSAPQEGIQWLSSKMRVADNAIAPLANKFYPRFLGLNEESWNGFDRKSVESDLISIGDFSFARDEGVVGEDSLVFSDREDAVEEFLQANPGFGIKDVSLVPVSGYEWFASDGTPLGIVNASAYSSPKQFDNAGSYLVAPNETKLYPTSQRGVYSLDRNGENKVTVYKKPIYGNVGDEDAFGWTPVPAGLNLETNWQTIIPLATGKKIDYTEAGWGGQSPDLFNEDGHLDYKNMVTNPGQTVKYLTNMLTESSPYMLGNLGLVAAGSDSIAGLRGFNPFKDASSGVTPGYHVDPGLKQKDEYWGNWASVTGEGATEALFGIGAGTLAKVGYKAKKAKEAADPAVDYAIASKKRNPIKEFLDNSNTSKVAGDIGRTALGEGIEEGPAGFLNQFEKGGWMDSDAPFGISPDLGNVGRSIAYDDLGMAERTPWGTYLYDQEETTAERVSNTSREILDAMVLGALTGGGLGTATKSPQLASAIKQDLKIKKAGTPKQNIPGLSYEEKRAIDEYFDKMQGKGE